MNKFRILVLLLLAIVVLACQTTDLISSYLAAAPTPTRTRSPTRPAVSASPTRPPVAIVATPTPSEVTGTVTTENSRVRSAPSTSAAIVARLNKGDQVKIVGRTTASDWWEIPLPSDPNARGWISADLIQVKGSTDTLPVVQPNAPPTPQPYPRP